MGVFTREGLRKGGNVADWSQITSIPQRVIELAALGDPGGLRLVIWDDMNNELAYLEALAEFVEYDNATSGLTATNVQDALDELEALISGSSATYGGIVGSSGGSFTGSAGFSVSYSAPDFTITHNLGTTNYVVQAQQRATNTPTRIEPSVIARNANDFVLRFYSATDAANGNPDWEFTLTVFTP